MVEHNESASTGRREGRVPDCVRSAMSFTCSGAVVAVGVALLLGTTAEPPAELSKPSINAGQPVRVDGSGNRFRIATRIPNGAGSIHLQILAPDGTDCLNLMFDHQNRLSYLHTSQTCPLSLGSAIVPGGGQVVNYRAEKVQVGIQKLTSGELGVVVTKRLDNLNPLSEVWISPEGSVQSARHGAD